jgi:hypothetical protein
MHTQIENGQNIKDRAIIFLKFSIETINCVKYTIITWVNKEKLKLFIQLLKPSVYNWGQATMMHAQSKWPFE